MKSPATEKKMASTEGPNGRPATNEATVIQEPSKLLINQSLPRPWVWNSQVEAPASGMQSAAILKPAKIGAACSHFGPSTTRVRGRARASSRPVDRKLISAMASYTRRNVRRYRSGSVWIRDSAGISTALIGMVNCSSGRIRRMEALEYNPTAAAPKNRPIKRLSAPRASEYIRLPMVRLAPKVNMGQV